MNTIVIVTQFISGAIMMGYVVAAIFFLRFWREARDRLFLWFAISFFLLAGQRLGLSLYSSIQNERNTWLYIIRLIAFLLIFIAILDKNRAAKRKKVIRSEASEQLVGRS